MTPQHLKWRPTPGKPALFKPLGSPANRQPILVRVLSYASGRRFYVEAIGKGSKVVRYTVKAESLSEPLPDLFMGIEGLL